MDLAVRSGGPEILLHRGRPVWKDLRHLGSWTVVSNVFFFFFFPSTGYLVHFHPFPGSAALFFVFFIIISFILLFFCTHTDCMNLMQNINIFSHWVIKM